MSNHPIHEFTIPSIYDQTLLQCRIFIPDVIIQENVGAVVAHPYAPLGGSMDDPVVDLVTAQLLDAGVTVGTFNFRKGGLSKASTSLTAKPEILDYTSFLYCFVQYLACRSSDAMRKPITIICGGYSYGSMIASHMIPWATFIAPEQMPPDQKALEAKATIRSIALNLHDSHGVPTTEKLNSKQARESAHVEACMIRTHYLLISPLLPPVTTLLAPLAIRSWWPASKTEFQQLIKNPSLAVYGTSDVFASSEKLRRWAETLAKEPGSRFKFAAVEGAGHFWHETGVATELRKSIKHWLETGVMVD